MILTGVTLTDYGVYGGRNHLDLSATPDRPVVLIGGLNGAGKTTLFESVMLCLYGMPAAGGRMTKKRYERLLEGRMHRGGDGSTPPPDRPSIAVQFRFFHDGQESEYRVERSWPSGRPSGEELDVARREPGRGEFRSIGDAEAPDRQRLIDGLVPPGIMRLFMFNGERIAGASGGGAEKSAGPSPPSRSSLCSG